MFLAPLFFIFCSFVCSHTYSPPKYSIAETSQLQLFYGDSLRLEGTLGLSFPDAVGPLVTIPCSDTAPPNSSCYTHRDNFATLVTTPTEEDSLGGYCLSLSWSASHSRHLEDCFAIPATTFLYGGAETYTQFWPNNAHPHTKQPYVSADFLQSGYEFGNVLENYWLTSTGVAIFVSEDNPLFVSYNTTHPDQLCFSSSDSWPYHSRPLLELKYTLCVAENIKTVHTTNFHNFYPLPTALPDERMFLQPLWSTWAQYHADIDQEIMIQLAQSLVEHGFSASSHVEIDDKWESCYGQEEFDPIKFPDPKAMVDTIKALGFRVTLWVQPFINLECPLFTTGLESDYFLHDQKNKTALVSWWGGSHSGAIDPTNPAAVAWWGDRLSNLQSTFGFDSFKFDAGEVNWLPHSLLLNSSENPSLSPNSYTTAYVSNLAPRFGGMVEFRAARHNQDLPIFTRIMDRDSHWGANAGLKSVIPTILLFGVLGYPFALPDMIGGTGFNPGFPTKELFLRWLAVNVFLPQVQFSVVPWDDRFDAETIAITLAFLGIREAHGEDLLAAARQAVADGSPINRPMWWVDPNDPVTFTLDQQFMMGDNILVAPVVEEGALSKDIYLPAGDWRSGVNNVTHTGPLWLRSYYTPLDVLPFFYKV